MVSVSIRLLIAAFSLSLAGAGCAQASAPLPTPSLPSSSSSQAKDTPSTVLPTPAGGATLMAAGAVAPAASTTEAVAEPAKTGGTVRIGLAQEPPILNPVFGSQTVAIIVGSTIMEGLLTSGANGTYLPVLADEVPSLSNGGVSQDGRSITWKLRRGVVWSDGMPFTSKDVMFTYQVMTLPENPVVLRAGYSEIESVTTPDDGTVVVTYKQPYAPYREHFPWILPEHVFGGNPAIDRHPFNRSPVGTGPFTFASWEGGTAITVQRNARFRESGKPYLDSIIFKLIPSREVAIQSFKVGEIDVLWNLAEPNLPEFDGMADASIAPLPSPRVERLILNTSCSSGDEQGQPDCPHRFLGDLRVRQAIELAIDKQLLVNTLLYGKTTVATSVIPLGWFAPSLQPSEYNVTRAKQLLDDAGWQSGADGIRTKEGVRARIELLTTSGDQLREQTQQVIQAQLRDVGIEVDLRTAPTAVVLGTWQDGAPRARGNFDILMLTFGAPGLEPHSFLQSNFHSAQVPSEQNRGGANFHRILDPEIDQALARGESTLDESQRKQAYGVVAERVNEGKGQVVLYNRLQLDAFKRFVKGWEVNVFINNLTWDAANWWIDR